MTVKNVCFIAVYDSYLKALAPIANYMAAQGVGVKFYIENNISERVIAHMGLEAAYEKLPIKNFYDGKYDQSAEAIFIGAGGSDFVKICKGVKPAIIKIALFNGVNADRIYQGFNDRSHADIILLNNSRDYNKYIKYAADFGVSGCRAFLLGFPFLKKISKQSGGDIVFFDQNFSTMSYSEKAYILDKLMQLTVARPECKVVIKLRNKPGEKTPHKASHSFEGIIKKISGKIKVPHNLVMSYDTMEDVLKSAALAISVSSTAVIEAVYNDITAVILSDFGIRTDFGNELFAGSNMYASFDDIISGKLPAINREWAGEYVVAAQNNYSALMSLLGSVQINPQRGAQTQGKKNIIREIRKNRNIYGGYCLSREIILKKYKKFKRSPRNFFEDSNNALVKLLSKFSR